MVHYVVMVPVECPNVNIPGVLMSHPDYPKNRRTTHYAELLPLLTPQIGSPGPCTPLLHHKKFRTLFQDGATFKLKVLEFGRMFLNNINQTSTANQGWSDYEPDVTDTRLRAHVLDDIAKFPMRKILGPSETRKTSTNTRRSKTTGEGESDRKHQQNQKATSTTRGKEGRGEGQSTTSAPSKKLSHYLPNLRIKGLSAAGGHRDFALWFTSLPPDIRIDNNFQCDTGILRKDTFRDMSVLDKYLGISEVV